MQHGMKGSFNIGQLVAMAAGLFLASGCALQIKVDEDWNLRKDRPIPLGEVTETWQQIRAGKLPSEEHLASYNKAVRSSVIQIADNWENDKSSLSEIKTTEGTVRIDVNPGSIRNVDLIDEVIPADFVRVKKGFDKKRTEIDGAGASLMIRQRWTEEDSMIPETGLWYPVTGILNFDQPRKPVLELYDPTKQSDFHYNGGSVPLSVDYTATFARDFYDRQRQFVDVSALFRFEKFADRMGMYRISAFDPEKEVCILIHGINSTPMTWHIFLNEAHGDKALRERYEFWTFGYPTGAPIPYLAGKLRTAIQEMQGFRRKNGGVKKEITIVGHSMGGILGRLVTQAGGQSDWDKLFNVPIEQLEVSENDREILRNLVYYEPIQEVDCLVLCAVPHQGSQLAANPGSKLIGDIIQVPRQLAQLSKEIVKKSSYALTPLGMELADDPTSLDQLRPGSRVTAEYLSKPLNPEVEYYSVIARKNPKVPLSESSDGVVPYTSSHLEGVRSEVVIDNSPHGVHRDDGGILEIMRILRLP